LGIFGRNECYHRRRRCFCSPGKHSGFRINTPAIRMMSTF
jgi:hypothetical protein